MYDGLKSLEIPVRPKRPRRKVLKVVLIGVLALGLSYVGYGVFLVKQAGDAFKKQVIPLSRLAEDAPNKPMNILVVGSDDRSVVGDDERGLPQFNKSSSGRRTDTILLLHISAEKRATLVTFPRDLRVAIPGHGKRKINAAYAYGGPQLMIDTVKDFTGLPIHHYVEINFVSFRAIVDAIHGVDVNVTSAIHDKKSGLNIPAAGCWRLKGQTALSYVRARYFDPRADLGRIDRQQTFMRALLKKVKSPGFLVDLRNVDRLINAVRKGFALDDGVTPKLAQSIAAKLATSDERKIDFRIVPSDPSFFNHTSYMIARQSEAQRLFAALAQDLVPPRVGLTSNSVPRPKDILLDIYNGTGKTGLASTQAARLRAKGYRLRYVQTADKKYAVTTIVYQPGRELKAKLLQRLYKGSVIVPATLDSFADVKMYLGTDRLPQPSGSPTATTTKPAPKPVDTKCRPI
jgi:LCP family protein required for cell wall assembly